MKKLKLGEKLSLFLLLIFSLWAAWPLYQPGLPNTHDGQHHVVRLAAFHQALVDGQMPPRWADNLNAGYGSPVLSFSFPLPFILAEFFHLAGLTFIESFKMVFVLGFLLSSPLMFLFLRKITGTLAAFVGSFLYLFIPYRFLDTYVRGEVGEAMFFIFPPLFLMLAWNLEKRDWFRITLTSLVVSAMFLSHPLLAGIFIAIFFLYFALKGNLLNFTLAIVIGSAIAAFNILPIVWEKGFTNADVFIKTNYQNQFPTLKSLIYSAWNWGPALPDNPQISMAFQLGLAQWLIIGFQGIFFVWLLLKKKALRDFQHKFLVLNLFLTVVIIFLMTPYSRPIWNNLSVLPSILYPWRLLGVEVFLLAVSGSVLIQIISQKKLRILLALLLVSLAFYGNRNHTQIVGRTKHHDAFYLSYPGTADMWGEFLPKNAKPAKEAPSQKINVINGEAEISLVETTSKDIRFKVRANNESLVLINTQYYPGWRIFIDDREVNREESEMLAFKIQKGEHFVRASFTETLLRKISNIISFISLIFVFGVIAGKLKKRLR